MVNAFCWCSSCHPCCTRCTRAVTHTQSCTWRSIQRPQAIFQSGLLCVFSVVFVRVTAGWSQCTPWTGLQCDAGLTQRDWHQAPHRKLVHRPDGEVKHRTFLEWSDSTNHCAAHIKCIGYKIQNCYVSLNSCECGWRLTWSFSTVNTLCLSVLKFCAAFQYTSVLFTWHHITTATSRYDTVR